MAAWHAFIPLHRLPTGAQDRHRLEIQRANAPHKCLFEVVLEPLSHRIRLGDPRLGLLQSPIQQVNFLVVLVREVLQLVCQLELVPLLGLAFLGLGVEAPPGGHRAGEGLGLLEFEGLLEDLLVELLLGDPRLPVIVVLREDSILLLLLLRLRKPNGEHIPRNFESIALLDLPGKRFFGLIKLKTDHIILLSQS